MTGKTNAGGAGLAFRVVGGTTAPQNPIENTIWVNTATAIGAWTLSPDAPISPAESDLWIRTTTVSNTPIEMLKRDNSIIINPVQCQQYQSGVWVEKAAQVYQSGAWKDVRSITVVYFNNGDLGKSGGFQTTAGTLSVGSEITLSISSGSPAYVTSRDPIDLAGFTQIKFMCRAEGVTDYCNMGVGQSTRNFSREIRCNWGSYAEATMDVSDLVGMYYIGFRDNSWSEQNNARCYVKAIILS